MKYLNLSLVGFSIVCCSLAGPVMAVEGDPFQVNGEQLVHAPPKGWRLAWMTGNADGGYAVEYIPRAEEIQSWRGGYLLIERRPYPPDEMMKELERRKLKISAAAIYQDAEKVRKGCPGKFSPMSMATNIFDGITFSVTGGFCDKYGPAAPFGEGAVVAFVEGKTHVFKIQYGWRPMTLEESRETPWGTDAETPKKYLEAIRQSSLCGDAEQPACANTFSR